MSRCDEARKRKKELRRDWRFNSELAWFGIEDIPATLLLSVFRCRVEPPSGKPDQVAKNACEDFNGRTLLRAIDYPNGCYSSATASNQLLVVTSDS